MKLFKIEIIIANTFLQELVDKLERLKVHGYTAIDISRGKGIKRGEHLAEGLLPTTRNTLIFTIAPGELKDQVIESIQPYLDERGGIIVTTQVDYASGLS